MDLLMYEEFSGALTKEQLMEREKQMQEQMMQEEQMRQEQLMMEAPPQEEEVFNPQLEEGQESQEDFFKNIAADLSESANNKISTSLLECIDEDIEARQDWMDSVEKAKKYLGFSIEDVDNLPFRDANRTFDTTFATALLRFFATTSAELLPTKGPVGFKILGEENEFLKEKGQLVVDWLNYYLTTEDKGYYPDCDKALLYLGLYGSCFKKVWQDGLLERPRARFVLPVDFIVDGDCSSVLDSTRITHILHLSKREILLRQERGEYLDVDLHYLSSRTRNAEDDIDGHEQGREDVELDAYTKRSLFPIYEIHTFLSLEDYEDNSKEESIPLPYVVTIDKITKKILSIRNNWNPNDNTKERKEFFVQYNYLPGFGIYGTGLAHILGTNAISLTKILRQLIDAGSFQNLPAGVRTKTFKEPINTKIAGPGEFIEIDTGGVPLREAFMTLPFNGPSAALDQVRMHLIEQSKEAGSTSELGMMDSKEDIPTGTMLAMLESNNRVQSAVARRVHQAFSHELQLIYNLFKENLNYEQFSFSSNNQSITDEDFAEEIKIIPISDPSVNSSIQKIIRAQMLLSTAERFPDYHNIRNTLENFYEAQGIEDDKIDLILLPDQANQADEIPPLDPITENMNMLNSTPVKAVVWQDHAAHKILHEAILMENPQLEPVVAAHMAEHTAYEYLIRMQQMIGYELPPLDQLQDPQVQNTIAMQAAQAQQQINEQQAQQMQEQAPIDPNEIVMAEIQQKEQDTISRENIAKLNAETAIFKSQLEFEKEKAKIESNEDIAQLKSDTELTKNNT